MMHKGCLFIVVVIILGVTLVDINLFAKGFSGFIYFREGDSLYFEHLGTKYECIDPQISGEFRTRNVNYTFSEFTEIKFLNPDCGYDISRISLSSDKGSIEVKNKKGKTSTLTECRIIPHEVGYIEYVITRDKLIERRTSIEGISKIRITSKTGDKKINQKTGRVFPLQYIYDPYTGDKLFYK